MSKYEPHTPDERAGWVLDAIAQTTTGKPLRNAIARQIDKAVKEERARLHHFIAAFVRAPGESCTPDAATVRAAWEELTRNE